MEKIQELLRYIDERLTKLEGEKEELKAYQKLDKQRRSDDDGDYDDGGGGDDDSDYYCCCYYYYITLMALTLQSSGIHHPRP